MSHSTSKRTPNQLLVLRQQNGYSRKQLAAFLGYRDAATIARIERGVQVPDLTKLLTFEFLYHRPIAFIYADVAEQVRHTLKARMAAAQANRHEGGGDA